MGHISKLQMFVSKTNRFTKQRQKSKIKYFINLWKIVFVNLKHIRHFVDKESDLQMKITLWQLVKDALGFHSYLVQAILSVSKQRPVDSKESNRYTLMIHDFHEIKQFFLTKCLRTRPFTKTARRPQERPISCS